MKIKRTSIRDRPVTISIKKNKIIKKGKSLMKIFKHGLTMVLSLLLTFGVLTSVPIVNSKAATIEENNVGSFSGNVTIDTQTWYKNTPRFTSTTSSGYTTDAFCVEPAKAPPFSSKMTFESRYISPVTNETALNVLYYSYNAPGFNAESAVFSTGNNTYAKTPKGAMQFFRERDNLGAGLSEDAFLYTFTHYAAAYAMYGADVAFGVNPGYDEYTYKNAVTSYVSAITNGISSQTLANKKSFLRLYLIDYGKDSQNIIFPVYRMRLEFAKVSTNPNFTNNNNLYSLNGAQFVVFKDKDAADIARTQPQNTDARKAGAISKGGNISYIYTQNNGTGIFKNFGYSSDGADYALVDIDNYYAIEYRSPKGYALNNNYYRFTDSGETDENGLPIYRINSSAKTTDGKPAFPNEPRLVLRIAKRSADTSLTEGNTCYSLENAQYGIYDSKADAENDINRRGVITTDKNGSGTYSNSHGSAIPAKSFWGKELTAPQGYAIDTEVHQFTFSGESSSEGFPIYSFESIEQPETDPITVLLQKYDVTTGKGTNTEKLANAEYTVKFYPAYYNSFDEIGDTQPLRSWVFKTDSGGRISFYPEHLVSGDELWYQEIGGVDLPTIPYGTITVQETKAPDGYLINPEIYLANINESNGNISWRTTNENIDGSVLQFPETPALTETFISKTDITGSKEVVGATLAVCEVDNLSTPIEEWISGKDPHRIEGLERGKEYVLIEKIPADGYVTANSITFKVNEDGSATHVTMKDDVTKIEIIKVNSNKQPVVGVKLQILDNDNNVIVPTWTTDGDPYRINGKLIVGNTYRLHEVSTLPQYLLADDVSFTVQDTPDVQTVTMVNVLKTGSVTLHKLDSDGKPIAGSQWQLFTADDTSLSVIKTADGKYQLTEDGQIHTMDTDQSGDLQIENLPFGEYYLVETKAPDDMQPYGEKIPFTISYEGENGLHADMTVKDYQPVLYNTGWFGVKPFYVMGAVSAALLCVGLGAFLLIKYKKKKAGVKTNEKNH